MSANRHGVNFVAHQCAQTLVDKLMPSNWPFVRECITYYDSGVMRIVFAENIDFSAGQAIFDKGLDFYWIHNE